MISNKQSKFIKSLKIKKYRDKESSFLIEGRKNVLEAIQSGFDLVLIVGTPDFLQDEDAKLTTPAFPLISASSEVLRDLGTFKTNNDCLAVARIRKWSLKDIRLGGRLIALDGISDPGNLGTIIRTLDWFGFDQLICSLTTTDFYNPKVINATMGSFTRVKVVYADLTKLIRDQKLNAFGADLKGTPLHQWNAPKDCMVVMGSESHGISHEVANQLAGRISIQQVGQAESLNVGIATGICCYHLTFQS